MVGVRESDGALVIRTAAPPVDGAANKAIAELVAAALGARRGQVALTGGATSRDKQFTVTDITEDAVRERLNALPRIAADHTIE